MFDEKSLSLLAMSFLAAFSFGCQFSDGQSEDREPEEVLEKVADEPRSVAGQTVTVEGRISRVLGDCAYEIEDSDLLTPDRALTLCEPAGSEETAAQYPDAVAVGDWLRITGVAGEMTREDYEYQSTLTLPDEVFGERTTRPVILIEKAEKIAEPKPDADGQARLPDAPVVVPIL